MADPKALLPVMAVGFAAAAVVGYAVASFQPTTYEARATLTESATRQRLVSDPQAAFASRRRLAQYEDIATGRTILEAVSARLEFGSPEDLGDRVSARTLDGGVILEVTALANEASEASALANAIAVELTGDVSRERGVITTLTQEVDTELVARLKRYESIETVVDRLRAKDDPTRKQQRRLRRLEAGLGELATTYARLVPFSGQVLPNQLEVIGPAVTPREPVAPRPAVDALLAGALGALVLTPLAFVPHFLDRVVRSPDDVREETGLATLAVVPRVPGDRLRPALARQAVVLAPFSTAADAYGILRWVCETSSRGPASATILVVGPSESEGASMVAANVALAFAQSGRRVVLIDADLDRPRTHNMLREPNGPGLVEALAGDVDNVAQSLQTTSHRNLHLLPAGDATGHQTEHVGSPKMRALLAWLKSSYDTVIIDSPPVDRSGGALVQGPAVDGLLLVADASHTRRSALRAAASVIKQSSSHVLGVALVNRPSRAAGWIADLLQRIRPRREQRPAVEGAPTAPQR